jgi:hypothetical protein
LFSINGVSTSVDGYAHNGLHVVISPFVTIGKNPERHSTHSRLGPFKTHFRQPEKRSEHSKENIYFIKIFVKYFYNFHLKKYLHIDTIART